MDLPSQPALIYLHYWAALKMQSYTDTVEDSIDIVLKVRARQMLPACVATADTQGLWQPVDILPLVLTSQMVLCLGPWQVSWPCGDLSLSPCMPAWLVVTPAFVVTWHHRHDRDA